MNGVQKKKKEKEKEKKKKGINGDQTDIIHLY